MANNFDPVRANAKYEREWYDRCCKALWRPVREEMKEGMHDLWKDLRSLRKVVCALSLVQLIQAFTILALLILR